MKRFAFAATLTALLVLVPGALGATALTGTYRAEITGQGGYDGTWQMTFTRDGRLIVKDDGEPVARGSVSSTTSTVSFAKGERGPGACPGGGRYKWTRAGDRLTFRRIFDTCAGRRKVLAYPYVLVR